MDVQIGWETIMRISTSIFIEDSYTHWLRYEGLYFYYGWIKSNIEVLLFRINLMFHSEASHHQNPLSFIISDINDTSFKYTGKMLTKLATRFRSKGLSPRFQNITLQQLKNRDQT